MGWIRGSTPPWICGACLAATLGIAASLPAAAASSPPKDQYLAALSRARELTDHGKFEAALRKLLWYWRATEYEPAQSEVRDSFAVDQWVDLAGKYPKAKATLLEIRDADQRQIAANGAFFDIFADFEAINAALDDNDRTYLEFKYVESRYPTKAVQYFGMAETALLAKKDYATCRRYIGDPGDELNDMAKARQREIALPDRPEFTAHREDQLRAADRIFEDHARQLILVLVGTGERDQAASVAAQALTVLDTQKLRSAVEDAAAETAR
jgi:hypothetical protein